MNSGAVPAVLSGLLGAVAVVYTFWAAKRGNRRVEDVEVIRSAYKQATEFHERVVAGLAADLNRVRVRLTEEEARSDELEKQVEQLQRFTDQLSRLLADHNIPLPAKGF